MSYKNNITHSFDVTRSFGDNDFLFNNSIDKETKPITNKVQEDTGHNIPACQQSSNVVNPCLMFRPMSRKYAADDYELILTTDCLFTPDYPVMIPSIVNMHLLAMAI